MDTDEIKCWAVFHLYIPTEKADDDAVSRLREHIISKYEGKMNHITDADFTEDEIDSE
jgi:hypothetical protein